MSSLARWGAAAAVVLLLGGAFVALRGIDAAPALPIARAERGDFMRSVVAEGNFQAAQATVLAAPLTLSMPVAIGWLAEDGSFVREGEVVVRFDPAQLREELRGGRADRETADRRIEQRSEEGGVKMENLERDAELAVHELNFAADFQSTDDDVFSRKQRVESQLDTKLAQERHDHAMQSREVNGQLHAVELQLLDIEKRKADLKIQRAERSLSALEIRAPHDGIFVLKRQWGDSLQVGQTVWRGTPVAEIPRLDEMEAEVWVLEADAGGLEPGLPVELQVEARPGMSYAASVKHVDALPSRRVRWVPVQYFRVLLSLEETDPEVMKPGQRVTAQFALERREDALTVPRAAVFEREGERVVYVRRGGGFEPLEVKLGPAALGRIVIEEGLEEGAPVALRDPTAEAESGEPVAGGPDGSMLP